MISVIVPALNEEGSIVATLDRLQPMRARGHEVLLVDGGSTDGTPEQAAGLVDQLLHGERGRARQMNVGAQASRGDVLWFLHADTLAPADADRDILHALEQGADWGWFRVRIVGRSRMLPVVAWFMNRRSCLTSIATGDQGLFVRRVAWEAAGGFPDIPLMEDIGLSRRLRREGRGCCLPCRLETSGRRWDRGGVWRTMFLMWRLRLAYSLGADPHLLAQRYR